VPERAWGFDSPLSHRSRPPDHDGCYRGVDKECAIEASMLADDEWDPHPVRQPRLGRSCVREHR